MPAHPKIHILFASFVILGIAGWVILIIPELHFLYKEYLGLLGQFKFLALLLAALGMFFALPIWLADRLYHRIGLTRGRYLVIAIACLMAIWMGKVLM